MKLVAGLGNPGLEYRGTRHNAGFEVVDALAARHGSGGRAAKSRFHGLLEEIRIGEERVLLLKPLTYMNRSGLSIGEAVRFHRFDPTADLMVLVDDMALDCGAIRVRGEGGAGGQQGLRDVERALGGNRYPRCRIGIGDPGEQDWSSYVLGRFRPEQKPLVEEGIARAADAVACWATRGLETAMNTFNTSSQGASRSHGADATAKRPPEPF